MKYLVCWLTMVLGFTVTFLSDLLIRTQDIPGTDPHAYDVFGSILIGAAGTSLLILLWRDEYR